MAESHTASASEEANTKTSPQVDADATPSLQFDQVPTQTKHTPDDYSPPEPPVSDDYCPPTSTRFLQPKYHKKGGMGRIFRATDSELNRSVAIKDIQPKHRAKDWYLGKFVFEAEVTGELEHPGIVPVYSLYRPSASNDQAHYVMRYVEGETLGAAIHTLHIGGLPTALTGEQIITIRRLLTRFLTVCETVAYAHSRGVIHRDLKPENVMLGRYGETLLLDWGLAKRLQSGETAPTSASLPDRQVSSGGGTPAYWAPEQAEKNSGHLHDERTDVYGLGAILFAILTGHSPHPGGQHRPEPPSPKEVAHWVDSAIDSITRRAMAYRQQDRYQSATELAEAVETWLAEQPVSSQLATVLNLRDRTQADPQDSALQELYARQLANLGQVYQGMGRANQAVEASLEAASAFEKLYTQHKDMPRFRAEQANCYISAAFALESFGRTDLAQVRQNEATEIYRGLIATHPGEFKQNLATIVFTREVSLPGPIAMEGHPDSAEMNLRDISPLETGEFPVRTSADPTIEGSEPELVQGYSVIRVIGVGGAGRVLLAQDKALRRLVAIKEFTQEFTGVRAQRFLREIQLTANLRHPNIVQVYTYGVHSGTGRPFLVMEHVEGNSLQEETRLFHEQPTPLRPTNEKFARLLRAFLQACDALEYAHSNSIAHRDAKPANIIVQPDGGAVVIDWGIAKGYGETRDLAAEDHDSDDNFNASMTRTGTIVGTPAYIPPEQLRGQTLPGPKGDIYTLGVGLYEILTGRLPFTTTSVVELMLQKVNGELIRPSEVSPNVPRFLEEVCLKAMQHDPSERYQTVAELGNQVNEWLQSELLGSGSTPTNAPMPRLPRSGRQPTLRPMSPLPSSVTPSASGTGTRSQNIPPSPPSQAGLLSRMWSWIRGA